MRPVWLVYLQAVARLNRIARQLRRERDEALDLAASLYADLHDAQESEAKVRADMFLVCAAVPRERRDDVMATVRDRRRLASFLTDLEEAG